MVSIASFICINFFTTYVTKNEKIINRYILFRVLFKMSQINKILKRYMVCGNSVEIIILIIHKDIYIPNF